MATNQTKLSYGPIMLDENNKINIFVEVMVPQGIADAIDQGNDDCLMNYDPNVGYTVNEKYYVSSYIVVGSEKLPISYETYVHLIKDSQNW